jgi:serine/threonine protein kinase
MASRWGELRRGSPAAELPTAAWDRVDEALERFEAAWQSGARPDLADYLEGTAEERFALLVELVHIDLELRLKAGEPARVEDYLGRFPELHTDAAVVLGLIEAEWRLRRRSGESVHPNEYAVRFPEYAATLVGRLGLTAFDSLESRLGSAATLPQGGPSVCGGAEAVTTPVVPGYEILGQLGRGGMGIVYRARDRQRDTVVALKSLSRLEPAALYRFKQEFRALADVVHPNLVTLYELIAYGRQWFFAMEFVEGTDFLAYVRGLPAGRRSDATQTLPPTAALTPQAQPHNDRPTPLSPEGISRLRAALRQLAAGLQALHEAGKLHRDVKPSNILVTGQGRVVLLDFGLATEADRAGQSAMAEGGFAGTVGYVAPEQASGSALSPATDWYSVGVILYEALTGLRPFRGPSLRVLHDKQYSDPLPPSALVADLPEDLEALCLALLRRKPELRPDGHEVLRQLGGATSEPHAVATARPGPGVLLVGRERHLRVLAEAFAALERGQPGLVCVCGRSGVGKTALVQHFLDDVTARAAAVVLAGRCFERESVPYKAVDSVVDALSRYLRRIPPTEAEALVPREVRPLARIFPVLRDVPAVARAPRRSGQAPDPHELRRRAFAALRELLTRLGRRHPLVITIDDLQWGDTDSAALLAELLRPPEAPPLLLLGSYRSEDEATSPFLRAFLPSLQWSDAGGGARRLEVEALTPQETRALAVRLLGRDDPEARALAETVAHESAGNPFFLGELIHNLQEAGRAAPAGPPVLDAVLWQRIAGLPQDARRLLEVAAVSGRPLTRRDACAAAELDADERQALAVLRNGRLLRGTGIGEGDDIETYHDRVRETVLAHLDADTMARHHGRLARAWEAGGQAQPELLATHFDLAGESAKAADYYAHAAGQAAEALAFGHAAQLYRRALRWPSWDEARRSQLQTQLGDALANAGRGAEAAQAYLAVRAPEPELALELQRRAAVQLLTSGHVDQGLAVLHPVLAAVGTRLAAAPWRALVSLLWRRAELRLRGLRFQERSEEHVSPRQLHRIDVSWSVVMGLSIIDPIRGADFQTRNLLLALRAGEPFRIARALAVESGHLGSSGQSGQRRATRVLEEADRLARRVNRPYATAMVEMAWGALAFFEQRWQAAVEACTRAEADFREHCTGVAWEIGTATSFALWSLVRLGRLAELSARGPALLQEALERGDRYTATNLNTQIMTLVRLAADESAEARRNLEQVMSGWSQKGYHVQHHNALQGLVALELYCGRPQAAWQRVQAEWPAFRRSLLTHVQDMRIEMAQLRGLCALAVAAAAADPRPFLRVAAQDARRLRRERMPWAEGLAAQFDGTIAALQGHKAAAALLAEAVSRFDAAQANLHAAATRRRLGRLLGGSEGADLLDQAAAWMKAQGIKDAERMTAVFAPGFSG